MINLFGVYECSADAKGRVMLPVALKKQLAKEIKNGFVMKRSIFSQSLEFFPMTTFNEMGKEVNKLNRFNKKNDAFIRLFNVGVTSIELDASGRFLIPKELLNVSKIKKDVVMAAAGDRVEIWDKKSYEKFIKEGAANFEKLAEEVMGGINSSSTNTEK